MRTAARSAADVSIDTIWLTGSPAKRNIENAMMPDRDHDADGLESAAKRESEHAILSLLFLVRRRTSRSAWKRKVPEALSCRDLVFEAVYSCLVAQ